MKTGCSLAQLTGGFFISKRKKDNAITKFVYRRMILRLVAALVLHNYVFMLFILWHSKIIYFVETKERKSTPGQMILRLNHKCSFRTNNKATRRNKLNINVRKQTGMSEKIF